MIQFGRLLSYPLTFKNLNEKIKKVIVNDITIKQESDKFIVTAIANDHQVELNIFGNKLSTNCPTAIFCDCAFFKYSLAYGLYKNNSLLYPENFILKPPKSKNLSLSLSGCKHIIVVAQALWTKKNTIFGV